MENIDLYYESIRQVYEQIKSWREPRPPLRERLVDWLVGMAATLLGLSVVPVLPALIVFIGAQAGIAIGSIDLSTASFGTFIGVWIGATIGTLLILGLMLLLNNKVDSAAKKPEGPPQTLSPEQLSFIAVYESYRELRIYFVSHIDQHVDKSLRALKRILPRELSRRDPLLESQHGSVVAEELSEEELIYVDERLHRFSLPRRLAPSLTRQIATAQSFLHTFEKHDWLPFDDKTRSVLQALVSFPSKAYYHLLDREDLPHVLSVLENLGKFVYAYLPEHKTYMEPEVLLELQREGTKALESFVKEMNDLAPYQPIVEQKEEPSVRLRPITLKEKILKFYADNVFLRFVFWFVVILLLTSGTVALVSQRVPQLDINVMVSMVVGTSVTGAAALAVFAPRVSKREEKEGKE